MRRLALPALALAAGLAAPAPAAFVVTTTPGAFTGSLAPGFYTETFNTGVVDSGPSFSFAGGSPAFGYTVSVPASVTPTNAVYESGSIIGNNLPNETLLFTPTTGNVSAFGGNFFVTNISDIFQPVAVTLTLTDSLGATLVETFTPTSASAGSFRGFTSNGLIVSALLSAPGPGQLYNSVDNVTVGQAAFVTAVPVPPTLVMALLGAASFGGGGLIRRRLGLASA